MKFLLSIVASAIFMITTSAIATAIDTEKTVMEAPEAINVNIKSGTSGFETEIVARNCPPFC